MFNEINQWLASRCGKFTASEIHKLMGKGRNEYFGLVAKTYIATKAAEILTLEPANQRGPTMAMEWGLSHEFEAMTKFKEKSKLEIEYFGGENPTFFPYGKYAGGSPDGMGKDFVIEIKCPFNSQEHLQHLLLQDAEGLKDYAPEYYWQITSNMLFSNRKQGIFISYDPRFEDQYQLKTLEINFNYDDTEILKERLGEAEKYLEELLSKVKI